MKRLFLALFLLVLAFPCFAQTTINLRKDGFNCVVPVSTATTLTLACSHIADDRAMYITDIQFGSSTAAATFTADTFPTLKYGSGTNCGTGTTVFWQAMTLANTTTVVNLSTPIKIPAGKDVCFIMSTASSKTIQIQGFYD